MNILGDRAKMRLRDQITGAQMGQRLANSWRANFYPKGRDSMEASAFIYSRAGKIIRAFEDGEVIRVKRRKWLTVPTDEISGKGWTAGWGLRGRKSGKFRARNVDYVTRVLGIPLRFVPLPNGNGMLVGPKARKRSAAASAKVFQRGMAGKKQKSEKEAIYFWMIKQAAMPKRVWMDRVANQAEAEIVPEILRQWQKEERLLGHS